MSSDDTPEVGVGPWVGPWPDGDHLDPELLRDGDRRNVADHYRYWRMDAVVADLDTRRHPFHVAIENWGHDFNIGSVVRTANAFNAAAFHIVGKRRWNRRGAMVTDRYQHEHHHPTVDDLVAWAATAAGTPERRRHPAHRHRQRGRVGAAGDLRPAPCVRPRARSGGAGPDPADAGGVPVVLHIEQFGSTRSINAGAAGAIAMHAWVRRHVVRPESSARPVESRRARASPW